MSVTIGDDGAFWYRHLAWVERAPASNEKLLLSMALLATVGPDRVIQTRAMAHAAPVDGVIDGDLWLVGHGDPELGPGIARRARGSDRRRRRHAHRGIRRRRHRTVRA